MLITDHWPYRYFTFDELMCPCGCGRMDLEAQWLCTIDNMRDALGFSLPANSGYRCPEYNKTFWTPDGQPVTHTKNATDFRVVGDRALRLVAYLTSNRLGGVGIRQNGPLAGRFIHGDGAAPRLWTYP